MSASQSRQELCLCHATAQQGRSFENKEEKKFRNDSRMMPYQLRVFSGKRRDHLSTLLSLFYLIVFLIDTIGVQGNEGSRTTANSTMEEAAHLCEIFADVL